MHYQWRFNHAGTDTAQIERLCDQAEIDYLEYIGIVKPPRHVDHTDAVNHLLRAWRGAAPREVARYEHCPVRWVKRQRSLAGVDAETGEPRPDSRIARIEEMARNGTPPRAIAVAMGLPVSRVLSLLPQH